MPLFFSFCASSLTEEMTSKNLSSGSGLEIDGVSAVTYPIIPTLFPSISRVTDLDMFRLGISEASRFAASTGKLISSTNCMLFQLSFGV